TILLLGADSGLVGIWAYNHTLHSISSYIGPGVTGTGCTTAVPEAAESSLASWK
ncbi:hypothetical protein DOTSEDRAFT_45029, partial [Dothistroma septosporum NZE10]